jgi:hypothetical protein
LLAKIDRRNPLFVIGEIARRLEQGLLTADEALDRARRAARAGGDNSTDWLRDKGLVGRRSTAESFFVDRIRTTAGRNDEAATAVPTKGQGGPKGWLEEILPKLSGGRTNVLTEMLGRFGKTSPIPAAVTAGGEGLAAVAGPIGLAVVGAKLASDEIAGGFRRAREDVESFGRQARAVVADRPMAVLAERSEQVAKNFERIPIVGQVYAEQVRLATGTVKTFSETVQAIVERGRALAAYDPEIARARANADVATIYRDRREARELSGQYATAINREAELEGTVRAALLPFKELIGKAVNDVLGPVNAVLRDVGPLVANVGRTLNEIHDGMTEASERVVEIAKHIPALGRAVELAEQHFQETAKARAAEDGRLADSVLTAIRSQADRKFRIGVVVGEEPGARDKLNLQQPRGVQFPGGGGAP